MRIAGPPCRAAAFRCARIATTGPEALARQREAWRIDRIRAAVASLPDVAADVLRGTGCTVSPPDAETRPLADPRTWLARYSSLPAVTPA